MSTVLRARPMAVGSAAVAALLGLLLLLAVPASAASGVSAAAATMKKGQVYVDPAMTGRFSPAQAAQLTKKISDADKPIFVAVIPASADYPGATVIRDLRTEVGYTGVYAVWRGDAFKAGADPQVLTPSAVTAMSGAAFRAHPGDVNGTLNDFVDQAVRQATGHGVHSGSGLGVALVAVPLGLLALGGAGAFLLVRRSRKRREEQRQAQLAQLRTVVDEDITAFGEELERLEFRPGSADADDAQRADYTHALDAYERAKRTMDAAQRPEEVRGVTEALEDGRFALATLAARREHRPLPERRPPCFFDPRHGPSVMDADWAPPGGATRSVPVCATDATRLAHGQEPEIRTVRTAYGYQPYWNAGPVYSPWAGGYYGSGLLPGLLVGTLLGSFLDSGPGWGGGYDGGYDGGWGGGDGGGFDGGSNGGFQGGDYSGADFNPADFGGFDGGGFDGGGFGDGGFGGGDSGDFGGF